MSASVPAKAPVAIVTMVYNEPDFLPLWIRYYGAQVGIEHCYIIDHGSDDGSTAELGGANLVRLPRTPQDNELRAKFVSEFCSNLLKYYSMVGYVDGDEFIVVDPERYSSLTDFAQRTPHDVTTSFGLNVIHRIQSEPDLELDRPILAQRPWAMAVSAMAKPVFTRRPIRWASGFHSADADMVFDGLFNFHLARCDLALGLRRQAKRRATPFAVERATHHHRHDDNQVRKMMGNWARLPTDEGVTYRQDCGTYSEFAAKLQAAMEVVPGRPIRRFSSNLNSGVLWRTPERFLEAF